jgi:hypothetical protein
MCFRLHAPTLSMRRLASFIAARAVAVLYRRYLRLNAKFESASSDFSCKQ